MIEIIIEIVIVSIIAKQVIFGGFYVNLWKNYERRD